MSDNKKDIEAGMEDIEMEPTEKEQGVENPDEKTHLEDHEHHDLEHSYPARLEIDYREDDVSRLQVLLRIFKVVPVLILYVTVSSSSLWLSTLMMLVVGQKYPRWWFDFSLESKRYATRCMAFLFLMTDKWPSTTDEQIVHLDIDFPGENVAGSLDRWGPIYKIFLSIPHFLCLFALMIGNLLALVVVWVYLLITGGKYPKFIFDYVVGYYRWALRFNAYTFLLVTDKYPPFSLE